MPTANLAEALDLSKHVNEDTGLIGDALIDLLGMDQGMEALAHVMERCGGLRLHISASSTARIALEKERARKLFRSNYGLREVAGDPHITLSYKTLRKVRNEILSEKT